MGKLGCILRKHLSQGTKLVVLKGLSAPGASMACGAAFSRCCGSRRPQGRRLLITLSSLNHDHIFSNVVMLLSRNKRSLRWRLDESPREGYVSQGEE